MTLRAWARSHVGTIPIQEAMGRARVRQDPPVEDELRRGVFYRGLFLAVEGDCIWALAQGTRQLLFEESFARSVDDLCTDALNRLIRGEIVFPGRVTSWDNLPWELHAIEDQAARLHAYTAFSDAT